jgi:hypothetical protein
MRIIVGAAAAMLLVGGILFALASNDPAARQAGSAPGGPTGTYQVARATPACGTALDGIRSPAETPFVNVKTVGEVSLEGLSVSVMQGVNGGMTYDFATSFPTGVGGFLIRWANPKENWHSCSTSLKNVSSAPGKLIATMAVPAVSHGKPTIIQVCVWRSEPTYTSQCGALESF